MLPIINLNPITKDDSPAKQIASLRSQLAQLKDGVEESLNSISYDNLNTALRKKIDSIDEVKAYAQEQANIVAQTIVADMVKVTGDIQVVNGNISALNGTVSGLRGEFDTLVSKAITTDKMSAISINANQITSGKITANQIDASNLKVKGANVDSSTISDLNAGDAGISTLQVSNSFAAPGIDCHDGYADLGTTFIGNKRCTWVYDSGLGEYVLCGR